MASDPYLHEGEWMLAWVAGNTPGRNAGAYEYSLTSIGQTPTKKLYCGQSPHRLNPVAKRILGPRMVQAAEHRETRVETGTFDGRRLITRVIPIAEAYSGQVLAVLGAYLYAGETESVEETAARLAEPAPVGVWGHPTEPVDGEIRTHWSDKTFELFGLDPADAPVTAAGVRYWPVVRALTELIPDEDAHPTLAELESWADCPGLHEHRYSVILPDRTRRYVRAVGWCEPTAPGSDHPPMIYGVLEEITEDQYLVTRTNLHRMNTAAIKLQPLFYVERTRTTMALMSRRFRKLTAKSPKQLIREICHPDDYHDLQLTFEKVASSPDVPDIEVGVRLLTPDQEWLPVTLAVAAVQLSAAAARPPYFCCNVTRSPIDVSPGLQAGEEPIPSVLR